MNLYEMTQEWQEVFEMLENPDIPEQAVFDTIEMIESDMDAKADGYGKLIANLEANADSISKEIKRLTARKKAMENKADDLKERLYEAMKISGRNRIQTPYFTFNIQKNGGKAPIIYTSDVPPAWLKPGEPDTNLIRKALDNGESLGFAEYGERGEALVIR